MYNFLETNIIEVGNESAFVINYPLKFRLIHNYKLN